MSLFSPLKSFNDFVNATNSTYPGVNALSKAFLYGNMAIQAIWHQADPGRVKQHQANILKSSADSFIAVESPIAMTNMLCNIGNKGACVPGADAGLVIASPSKIDPNCKYHMFTLLISKPTGITIWGEVSGL